MDDLISRQAAIVAILNLYPDMPRINVCGSLNRWREKNEQYIECEEAIKKLPSVKWKKGTWILSDEQRQEDVDNGNYRFICSECGKCEMHSKAVTVSFCWNCGADMREEKRR